MTICNFACSILTKLFHYHCLPSGMTYSISMNHGDRFLILS